MNEGREITVRVEQLRVNDVYTPFDYTWQNVLRWVAVAFGVYLIYDLWFKAGDTATGMPDSQTIVIVVLGVLLGLSLYPYIRLHTLMRRSPGFRRPRTFVFTAEGLRFASEDADGNCKWTLFARIIETRKVFVFSQTGFSGTYIPKRYFASPEDVRALRQLISENFKGKRTLRGD